MVAARRHLPLTQSRPCGQSGITLKYLSAPSFFLEKVGGRPEKKNFHPARRAGWKFFFHGRPETLTKKKEGARRGGARKNGIFRPKIVRRYRYLRGFCKCSNKSRPNDRFSISKIQKMPKILESLGIFLCLRNQVNLAKMLAGSSRRGVFYCKWLCPRCLSLFFAKFQQKWKSIQKGVGPIFANMVPPGMSNFPKMRSIFFRKKSCVCMLIFSKK